MMRFKMVANVAVIALIGLGATLLAQQPGGQKGQGGQGGQGGGRGGGNEEVNDGKRDGMRRLSDAKVKAVLKPEEEEIVSNLGINDEQEAKLAEIRQQNIDAFAELMREQYQGGRGGGNDEANQAKRDELRRQGDAKLLAVLTPEQQKKFEEMKG